MDNLSSSFTIGHHETNRPLPVTAEAVASAHASGYDVVTSPITSAHFHSRVLTLLSNSFSDDSIALNNITSSLNASPIVISPLGPADTPLTPDDTINQTVGITAAWTDLGSPDPIIADVSRQVLRLELAYAAFCGMTYVVIPGPRIRGNSAGGSDIVQFARAILDALGQGPFMTIYIWLPMINHSENQQEQIGDIGPFARSQYLDDGDSEGKKLDLFGTWQAWDIIRSICRYSTRLCVALSLPKLLPPTAIQTRWYSEPVRILTLGVDTFVKNPKGYPVLSKAHQAFIFRFIHGKSPSVWFLLCDIGPVPRSSNTDFTPSDSNNFPSLAQAGSSSHIKDPTPHLSYMRNLQTKVPPKSIVETFGAGYQDYLQAPLQPLTVNLESITYEVFEKDPIKYEWYERAVARALHDWIEQGKPTSNPDGRVVVAVVGAGRGPLVTRALRASEAVGVEIDMWALEKNPNAFVLLQRHNETTWNRKVSLVKSDMRTWRGPVRPANASQIRKSFNLDPDEEAAAAVQEVSANNMNQTQPITNYTGSPDTDTTYLLATATHTPTPYKIDILISELLGSFGDNELSPECLDGVQHLLNPTHGISIPASYTAHITPIAAPKLHADISLQMINSNPNAAEVPYVVMLNAIDYLSTETVGLEPQSTSPTKSTHPNPPTSPARHIQTQTQTQPLSQPQSHLQSQNQTWSTIAKKGHTSKQPSSPPPPSNTPSHPSPQTQTQTQTIPLIHQTWSFHHPNPHLPTVTTTSPNHTTTLLTPPTNAHNARHNTSTFAIPHRATCHGIAGYFESVLYEGVELSTNPVSMAVKSRDMISWFPIFFPLKTPLHCPDDSSLTVQMWRMTDDRKVWYEWIVDVFVSIEEGGNGKLKSRSRRVRVGGSELHSSEKEACLM